MLKNIIIQNSYYDSATLMLLTSKLKEKLSLNSDEVAIMMATDMNKRIIKQTNLLTEQGEKANSGDVLVAIRSNLSDEEILTLINDLTKEKKESNKNKDFENISSVKEALKRYEEYNFAVVSLPGIYAAREVKKLLHANKHVLLFSDNVSIEDEVKLKDLAISKDLLMMGPDCGTAIINGVGLGFSNKVNKGNIGIVAASGTGLQEVSSIISNKGRGISQAFGTGGRDIKNVVGGKMMLYCLDLLLKDDNTKIIVIVSKPPEDEVIEKIKSKLKNSSKPVIACFLGANKNIFEDTNIKYAKSLEQAALMAIELDGGIKEKTLETNENVYSTDRKYIRAVYCGGTLAYESLLFLEENGYEVYSNLSKYADKKLKVKDLSKKHSVLDMGDDEFTVGRPHPMIDPSLRSERLYQESLDEDVAVILADIELGYGSSDDACKILCSDIENIKAKRKDLIFIIVLCASVLDYQGYENTKKELEKTGAIVLDSNAKAINLAMNIVKK